jgi:hypothetical protein
MTSNTPLHPDQIQADAVARIDILAQKNKLQAALDATYPGYRVEFVQEVLAPTIPAKQQGTGKNSPVQMLTVELLLPIFDSSNSALLVDEVLPILFERHQLEVKRDTLLSYLSRRKDLFMQAAPRYWCSVGTPKPAPPAKDEIPDSSVPFETMKNHEAAFAVLNVRQKGMTIADLFREMKTRCHPVASPNALRTSIYDKKNIFKNFDGLWGLASWNGPHPTAEIKRRHRHIE